MPSLQKVTAATGQWVRPESISVSCWEAKAPADVFRSHYRTDNRKRDTQPNLEPKVITDCFEQARKQQLLEQRKQILLGRFPLSVEMTARLAKLDQELDQIDLNELRRNNPYAAIKRELLQEAAYYENRIAIGLERLEKLLRASQNTQA